MAGRLRLPVLSGLLVGVSYLPGPFLPLNLAGFLPLLVWLDCSCEASAWERCRAGFVFGLVTHLVALHFMYSMLEQSWLAALLYVGMAGALALRIALSVALMGWLRRRLDLSWGLLLPLGWLPWEWAQTWGDLRMTGEHLAHTVAGYPFLVQFAALVGPYGVGACLLAVNGLIYEALTGRGTPRARRAALTLGLLAVAVVTYDAWAWLRPEPAGQRLRVALIQPNVSLAAKHATDTAGEQWRLLVDLSLEAARSDPDLIIWPESARPLVLYHDLDRPETYRMPEIQDLARRLGTPLLVGSEYVRYRRDDLDRRRIYNAVFAVDAQGRLSQTWGAKVYLVPFVEATPFRALLGPLVAGRGGEWRWVSGGFEPGPRPAVIEVAGARVGTLVCYEQLFPDLARRLRNDGARLQAVITNDAWFGRSLFQPYQANAARLRAIENRTPIVRVANTGISGFVDARGRYHGRTRLFEKTVEVRDVTLAGPPSLYARLGDVVAWLAVAGLLAAVAAARRASPRP